MIEVTFKEFKEVIKDEKILVLFYASWCGPCKEFNKKIENISVKYEFPFYRINIDNNAALAATQRIKEVPTLIIYSLGKNINSLIGFTSDMEIENFLTNN